MATLPNTDISIMDVHNILSDSSYDLGTLCTSSNINKWSKWKPISYNGLTIDNTILQNQNWGLTVAHENNLNTLISRMSSELPIKYNSPTGGTASPYRLGDFRNYNHSAVLPIESMGNRTIKTGANNLGQYPKTTLSSITAPSSSTQIGFRDIYPSNLTHRGIYMVKGSQRLWCTDAVDWSELIVRDWNGLVTCYDFYTNVSKPSLTSNYSFTSSDEFYMLPNEADSPNPYLWNIDNSSTPAGGSSFFFTLRAFYNDLNGSGSVQGTVTMSSIGTEYSGGRGSNITVGLSLDINASSGLRPQKVLASSWTIGSEETKTWPFLLSIPSNELNQTHYCHVYCNGIKYATSAIFKPANP